MYRFAAFLFVYLLSISSVSCLAIVKRQEVNSTQTDNYACSSLTNTTGTIKDPSTDCWNVSSNDQSPSPQPLAENSSTEIPLTNEQAQDVSPQQIQPNHQLSTQNTEQQVEQLPVQPQAQQQDQQQDQQQEQIQADEEQVYQQSQLYQQHNQDFQQPMHPQEHHNYQGLESKEKQPFNTDASEHISITSKSNDISSSATDIGSPSNDHSVNMSSDPGIPSSGGDTFESTSSSIILSDKLSSTTDIGSPSNDHSILLPSDSSIGGNPSISGDTFESTSSSAIDSNPSESTSSSILPSDKLSSSADIGPPSNDNSILSPSDSSIGVNPSNIPDSTQVTTMKSNGSPSSTNIPITIIIIAAISGVVLMISAIIYSKWSLRTINHKAQSTNEFTEYPSRRSSKSNSLQISPESRNSWKSNSMENSFISQQRQPYKNTQYSEMSLPSKNSSFPRKKSSDSNFSGYSYLQSSLNGLETSCKRTESSSFSDEQNDLEYFRKHSLALPTVLHRGVPSFYVFQDDQSQS